MTTSRLLRILLVAAMLAVVAYSCLTSRALGPPYVAPLLEERRLKDDALRTAPDSPLNPEQRAAFHGLHYYAPDSTAAVTARLTRFAQPALLEIATSDQRTETYLRWGEATFTLPTAAGPQKLALLRKASNLDSTLFVPFTDATNGRATYGGGRFLDVRLPAPDATEITLDFNRAYNPYCAYNTEFSCPVPPADNRLKIAIPFGEQYHHE